MPSDWTAAWPRRTPPPDVVTVAMPLVPNVPSRTPAALRRATTITGEAAVAVAATRIRPSGSTITLRATTEPWPPPKVTQAAGAEGRVRRPVGTALGQRERVVGHLAGGEEAAVGEGVDGRPATALGAAGEDHAARAEAGVEVERAGLGGRGAGREGGQDGEDEREERRSGGGHGGERASRATSPRAGAETVSDPSLSRPARSERRAR